MSSGIFRRCCRATARSSIRAIIIVVGTLIVGMWSVVGTSLVVSYQRAIDDAKSEARNLAVAVREEIAYILRGVDGEMEQLAQQISRSRGTFDLYEWGQRSVLVAPGIAQATFVGTDGFLISTTVERHTAVTDLGDREHVRVQLNGQAKGLYIGPTVIGKLTHAPILPISRRVEAADGSLHAAPRPAGPGDRFPAHLKEYFR